MNITSPPIPRFLLSGEPFKGSALCEQSPQPRPAPSFRQLPLPPPRIPSTPRTQPSSWLVVCAKSLQSFLTLYDPMDCSSPSSSGPWDSPGKNAGEGCDALLQGIFLIQGSNSCLSLESPALAAGFLTTSTTWEGPSWW